MRDRTKENGEMKKGMFSYIILSRPKKAKTGQKFAYRRKIVRIKMAKMRQAWSEISGREKGIFKKGSRYKYSGIISGIIFYLVTSVLVNVAWAGIYGSRSYGLSNHGARSHGAITYRVSGQVDPFYLRLLDEGKSLFAQNKFAEAVKNLEIAAFGLIEERPRLLEAYVYLVISNYRLRQLSRAAYFTSEIERLNLKPEFERANLSAELYNQFLEMESILGRLALAARAGTQAKTEAVATSSVIHSPQSGQMNFTLEAMKKEGLPVALLSDMLPPPQPTAIQEAIKLEEAVKHDPRNGVASIRLAMVYEELGHWSKARSLLKRYLKINPGCEVAHFELGRVLLQLRKPKDALKEIQLAASVLEGDIEFHVQKARAHEQLRQVEEARREWERVATLKK